MILSGESRAGVGVFKEFPVPTAGAGPTSIAYCVGSNFVWFAETDGNRMARMRLPGGEIEEFVLPSKDSGPSGIACGLQREVWFTEFKANKIGRISESGAITEIAVPTPDSGPLGIAQAIGGIWFTESRANKIGQVAQDGTIVEYSVPTQSSGPRAIISGPDFLPWFTEFDGNKIASFDPLRKTFAEYPVPTANSQPWGLAMDTQGTVWFTEFAGNKIGSFRTGTMTEVPLPTANAGPTEISSDFGIWFAETSAGALGSIAGGRITEYKLPGTSSGPNGILLLLDHVLYSARVANRVGDMQPDSFVILGAGAPGRWDTSIELSNRESAPVDVAVSYSVLPFGRGARPPEPVPPCVLPTGGVSVPGNGTAEITASSMRLAGCRVLLFATPIDGIGLPTASVRVGTSDPGQGGQFPATRLSTITAMNPGVLSFPAASRGIGERTDLLLANLGSFSPEISVLVEAYSAPGARLGSLSTRISANSMVSLYDVLFQLGVPELAAGHLKVTKVGGNGLMWGMLAKVNAAGAVFATLGANP